MSFHKSSFLFPFIIMILLFLLIGGGAFYLQTLQNNQDVKTETRQLSEDTKLTTKTSSNNLVQYTIDTKSQNSKGTTYLENSWVHPELILNQQELLSQANNYSKEFERANLNCFNHLSEEDTNEIIGITCRSDQRDENTFEMFRIDSGTSQIDALPDRFSNKQDYYNEEIDHYITLFKHCIWTDESLEETNIFSC